MVESDPLGDSHRAMGMVTYSISKIAVEATVSLTSRRLGLPTVIARLNVPYGDTYGWMLFHLLMMERGMAIQVYEDQPNSYNPIHADDQVASLPYLLSMASTPATAVNWCGPDVVSIEDWCGYYGESPACRRRSNPPPWPSRRWCATTPSSTPPGSVVPSGGGTVCAARWPPTGRTC